MMQRAPVGAFCIISYLHEKTLLFLHSARHTAHFMGWIRYELYDISSPCGPEMVYTSLTLSIIVCICK